MLEAGTVLSVQLDTQNTSGFNWPNQHGFRLNNISEDIIVKDLQGNSFILKNLIPQEFFSASTASNGIQIMDGNNGANYNMYYANNNLDLGDLGIEAYPQVILFLLYQVAFQAQFN